MHEGALGAPYNPRGARPGELEVTTAMTEVAAPSLTEETEKEATQVLAALEETAPNLTDPDSINTAVQDSELWWDPNDLDDEHHHDCHDEQTPASVGGQW